MIDSARIEVTVFVHKGHHMDNNTDVACVRMLVSLCWCQHTHRYSHGCFDNIKIVSKKGSSVEDHPSCDCPGEGKGKTGSVKH